MVRMPKLRTIIIVAVIVVVLAALVYPYESGVDNNGVGARAADIHRIVPFASIGYEFDWQEGAAPDSTAVSRLLDFGARYSGKATFSNMLGGALPAPTKGCYTDAE